MAIARVTAIYHIAAADSESERDLIVTVGGGWEKLLFRIASVIHDSDGMSYIYVVIIPGLRQNLMTAMNLMAGFLFDVQEQHLPGKWWQPLSSSPAEGLQPLQERELHDHA